MRDGRVEIRLRRAVIVGAIEMLGVQHGVGCLEPVGGTPVQLAPTGSQQRRVGAFLNQRVREQKFVAFRHHKRIGDQRIADIVGFIDETPQQRHVEALSDHSSCLKCLAVAQAQSVHACEHQTLDRGGDSFIATFFCVAQELFEK